MTQVSKQFEQLGLFPQADVQRVPKERKARPSKSRMDYHDEKVMMGDPTPEHRQGSLRVLPMIIDDPENAIAEHPMTVATHYWGDRIPIHHVYRGMSHEEWNNAQANGHIKSDERENGLPGFMGTAASHQHSNASHYVNKRSENGGVVAKIKVHPKEKWFIGDYGFAYTRHPIPLSRVKEVTTVEPRPRRPYDET